MMAQSDNKENALLVGHTSLWTNGDAAFSNEGATPDGTIGGIANCVAPTKNVWFKFQATSNTIKIKVLTGAGKGTLTYPIIHLTDNIGSAIKHSETGELEHSMRLKALHT